MSNHLEVIALKQVQEFFPNNPIHRKGFMKALRADPDWDGFTESGTASVPRLVPDAWFRERKQEYKIDHDVRWMWADAETARDLGGLDDWPFLHDTNGDRILAEPYDWFTAIEIENENPLTFHKLHWYAQIEDCYHGAFSLFVFDRYGLNGREIDVGKYYLADSGGHN